MIEARQVSKRYHSITAVNELSLKIQKGEVLGLIGESGCGKSTLAKLMMRLEPPTSGTIFLSGEEITHTTNRNLAKKIQMVFQDPYSSLNPLLTVEKIVNEPLLIHKQAFRTDELLEQVGLPLSLKKRYPHELSGGQRQRLAIARAISLDPEFLICDEPISSLDPSIQMQIVKLLLGIQQRMGLTILFIGHDLPMIRYISDRIAVMKSGKIVESLNADDFFEKGKHPETKRLISSILLPEPRQPLYQTPRNKEAIDLKSVPTPE